MRFIILFLLIIIILFIYNLNQSKYPHNLNNYIIYGKLDKKDKKTYHYQFKNKIFFKIDKYGNIIDKGKYKYKKNKNKITIFIKIKKYEIKLGETQNKNIFIGNIQKRKIILLKIKKMKYPKKLDGKIIKFINIFSDKKNNKFVNLESIIYYGNEEYTEFNPFIKKKKKYKYFVNSYGKAYIMGEKEIIKLLYKDYNNGTFILKSGTKIIEGKFNIIN